MEVSNFVAVPPFGFDIDVSDQQILIHLNTGGSMFTPLPFNGFAFTDYTGTITDFTSVAIHPGGNCLGINLMNILFDANHIYINFSGRTFLGNQDLVLDVNTVPEPASLMMLGIGLICMLGYAQHRKRAQKML
jgi:hypothetical protein